MISSLSVPLDRLIESSSVSVLVPVGDFVVSFVGDADALRIVGERDDVDDMDFDPIEALGENETDSVLDRSSESDSDDDDVVVKDASVVDASSVGDMERLQDVEYVDRTPEGDEDGDEVWVRV